MTEADQSMIDADVAAPATVVTSSDRERCEIGALRKAIAER